MTERGAALLALMPIVQKAARITALEWPNVIDAEDAEQEIVLSLLADSYATTVAELDDAARLRVLVKIGGHVAARYRGDYETFSGNVLYSTKEVRRLLDGGALNERGSKFDAGRADVVAAFVSLPADYQNALRKRYVVRGGQTEARARKQLQRAVDALTELMNRAVRRTTREHDDGPGSRTAISNEEARRLSRQHS
ncbi:hypothetical protein [Amycolatopsis minnesotensis]|uniref:Uncharacterized protein n=1 Tax=Amycolatopsis minnesotensis TaxID=337894 RepID=A0ABN2Q0R3_9PSEU